MAASDATVASPPEWVDDESVKNCMGPCQKEFTWTRRRHHCRGCGGLFCDDCSTKRKELPEAFNMKGKQRVCDNCFYALQQAEIENNPDDHPPKPDYNVEHVQLLADLKTFISVPEDQWHKRASNKYASIYTRKMENSAILSIRTEATVATNMEKSWSVYCNKDLWKNWQPEMKECRTIEEVQLSGLAQPDVPNVIEKRETLYVLMILPVIDNRDSVVYSATLKGSLQDPEDPKARTIISRSVHHPLCPTIKGAVRAHVTMGVTTFRAIDVDGQEHTKITTMLHTDPRGLLPPIVVNQGLARGCDQIKDMCKFIVNYKE